MKAVFSLNRLGAGLALSAAAVCALMTSIPAHAEGALAQLYAARPPAGSSFVRLVNPEGAALKVKIADGPVQTLSGTKIASTYAIVKGDTPFVVEIDGKRAAPMRVAPDSFNTLVPRREAGKVAFTVINDGGGSQDALKAELRFYNLSSECASARLDVAPSGPTLFPNVAAHASAARAINPVSAKLTAACAQPQSQAASQVLTLPALQPGDHYSLFLTGAAAKPVLRGQASATDTYKQ
ncbi:cell division protein FtsQ [Pandoraea communis]|uniref:Alginate biosynthesis protein AlgF n=1 Tax=Pandoraea communis TaxID=2508297 RepID=A0A5E4VHB8_9BURK|nr:cell division protein FtsQ [Pandoraea communis]